MLQSDQRFEELERQLKKAKLQQYSAFMYEEYNLVTDVDGATVGKWALNAAKILFTTEELIEHVLVSTNKSERPSLQAKYPEKVKLLKEAMIARYNYDVPKASKYWSAVVYKINNSGRNSKYVKSMKRRFMDTLGIDQ